MPYRSPVPRDGDLGDHCEPTQIVIGRLDRKGPLTADMGQQTADESA
jgi:hypothetical protein